MVTDLYMGLAADVGNSRSRTGAKERQRRFSNNVAPPCHRDDGTGMAGKYPPVGKTCPEVLISSRSYLIKVLLYGLAGKIDIRGGSI